MTTNQWPMTTNGDLVESEQSIAIGTHLKLV